MEWALLQVVDYLLSKGADPLLKETRRSKTQLESVKGTDGLGIYRKPKRDGSSKRAVAEYEQKVAEKLAKFKQCVALLEVSLSYLQCCL